ncbi:MAG TPA: nucleotidyltransferase family protein [bacterium]|nr:nucleotidyltransferase family protein [bacterium]
MSDTPLRPGPVLEALLREGLGASTSAIKQRGPSMRGEIDWVSLCALSHRCRIAPVLYQCLRGSVHSAPRGVMEWFRTRYYENVAQNLALQNELRDLLRWLSEAGVPVIVLKGLALAHLGLGLARTSRDLDVLIHDGDLPRVDAILERHGYQAWPDPTHDFHRRYGRSTPSGTRVVEVHFTLSDRPRNYRPDVPGIWSRSEETAIFEAPARVPELQDHLLLTLMQVPHHHWAMRLLVDVWQVVLRWGDAIDWAGFLIRAGEWQMGVLTRSTLHALGTMFGVPIPSGAMSTSQPRGYLERVQWRVARGAIAEQLEHPFRPRMTYLAPFMMVDHPRELPGTIVKRTLGADASAEEDALHTAARRTTATAAALPALGRVLLASIAQPRSRGEE